MDSATRSLIEAIHRSPMRAALVLTGGGTGASAQLLAVPGGSRTILEVAVPYHEDALCGYLGFRPEQFCSAETAAALAERALERARALTPGESFTQPLAQPLAGLAVTASLATDRPKRGDHRFYVATAMEGATTVAGLILKKDARDREGEETLLDAVILNQLAQAFGVKERLSVPLLPDEKLEVEDRSPGSLLDRLLKGAEACLCLEPDGRLRADAEKPRLLLPGAFNPLHEGHRRLARTAEKLTGMPAAFELSILNVDKPPLQAEAVRQRMRQFHWLAPLWLTRAATFAEKVTLFPAVVFVVGIDTLVRIVDARYYDNDPVLMAERLEHLRSRGCRFLVAGRKDAAGLFRQLPEAGVPPSWRDLFTPVPEQEFHCDLSSTELREPVARPGGNQPWTDADCSAVPEQESRDLSSTELWEPGGNQPS